MDAKCSGEHFRMECKIDGVWYEDDFVFPARSEAVTHKRKEESYGTGHSYRIVSTSAPVKLPPSEGEGDEDGSSSKDGPSSLFDWPAFLDLTTLCPASLRDAEDGDMDRIYARCSCGYSVTGEVFL